MVAATTIEKFKFPDYNNNNKNNSINLQEKKIGHLNKHFKARILESCFFFLNKINYEK